MAVRAFSSCLLNEVAARRLALEQPPACLGGWLARQPTRRAVVSRDADEAVEAPNAKRRVWRSLPAPVPGVRTGRIRLPLPVRPDGCLPCSTIPCRSPDTEYNHGQTPPGGRGRGAIWEMWAQEESPAHVGAQAGSATPSSTVWSDCQAASCDPAKVGAHGSPREGRNMGNVPMLSVCCPNPRYDHGQASATIGGERSSGKPRSM